MEFTAKTVDLAIEEGLNQLNLTKEEVDIVVKEEPTKGLFGKLKGKAVVEITKKLNGNEKAALFVEKVLKLLDINAKTTLVEGGENPIINLIAEDSAEVIGYRGEILDSIQTLAGAIANIGKKEYKKVLVNCENYREKREETLISLAHKLEEKATAMRRKVVLEAMNPFERKIIHSALAESQTVTTKSEGKEPNRYVVIIPNDIDEDSTPYIAARKTNGQKGGKKEFKRGGRDRKSSFRKNSSPAPKKSSSFSFGTYLGNSLKKDD